MSYAGWVHFLTIDECPAVIQSPPALAQDKHALGLELCIISHMGRGHDNDYKRDGGLWTVVKVDAGLPK